MGRWAHLDSDEERLPEGMRRVAYDADTQIYSYMDSDGSMWEGVPGAKYGRLHRVSNETSQAPALPVFVSDDKEIAGDEPDYVLHDSDVDDDGEKEKTGDNTTFDAILSKSPATTEPQKAYIRRWNSLSRAATKILPKLPPLPGDSRIIAGSRRRSADSKTQSSSLPRRRASTLSTITRGVAGGMKQMFAEQSDYRTHRA
jgi:hypothetical protein